MVSPCQFVHLSVCPSVDRILSNLYLQQYSSDPFHICTSFQATSEGVTRIMFISKFKHLKFWQILKICSFDFVFFWLRIEYDSVVYWYIPNSGHLFIKLLYSESYDHHGIPNHQGAISIQRPLFPCMGIPMLKIKLSRDCPIFNMGYPILVRWHFCIETAPSFSTVFSQLFRPASKNTSNST